MIGGFTEITPNGNASCLTAIHIYISQSYFIQPMLKFLLQHSWWIQHCWSGLGLNLFRDAWISMWDLFMTKLSCYKVDSYIELSRFPSHHFHHLEITENSLESFSMLQQPFKSMKSSFMLHFYISCCKFKHDKLLKFFLTLIHSINIFLKIFCTKLNMKMQWTQDRQNGL